MAAFAPVAGQCELADHQSRSRHIERAVHFFFGIIKDSKARDAVGQKIGIGFRITLGDAHKMTSPGQSRR